TAAAARHVVRDHVVFDGRGCEGYVDAPTIELGEAMLNRESLQHRAGSFTGVERDHGRGVPAVDDGRARTLGTLDGDRLAKVVDVLHVRAGRNDDSVPTGRRVDSGLDRREVGRNIDRRRGMDSDDWSQSEATKSGRDGGERFCVVEDEPWLHVL